MNKSSSSLGSCEILQSWLCDNTIDYSDAEASLHPHTCIAIQTQACMAAHWDQQQHNSWCIYWRSHTTEAWCLCLTRPCCQPDWLISPSTSTALTVCHRAVYHQAMASIYKTDLSCKNHDCGAKYTGRKYIKTCTRHVLQCVIYIVHNKSEIVVHSCAIGQYVCTAVGSNASQLNHGRLSICVTYLTAYFNFTLSSDA